MSQTVSHDRGSVFNPGPLMVAFGGQCEYGTAVSESTSVVNRYTTLLWVPFESRVYDKT